MISQLLKFLEIYLKKSESRRYWWPLIENYPSGLLKKQTWCKPKTFSAPAKSKQFIINIFRWEINVTRWENHVTRWESHVTRWNFLFKMLTWREFPSTCLTRWELLRVARSLSRGVFYHRPTSDSLYYCLVFYLLGSSRLSRMTWRWLNLTYMDILDVAYVTLNQSNVVNWICLVSRLEFFI